MSDRISPFSVGFQYFCPRLQRKVEVKVEVNDTSETDGYLTLAIKEPFEMYLRITMEDYLQGKHFRILDHIGSTIIFPND